MASVISGDANVSATEFGYLDGVTSALQTQMDAKLPIAGGKILQVVRATDSTNRSTTSTSFVDANLSVTITPENNTSAILLIAAVQAQVERTDSSQNSGLTAIRITDSANNAISGAEQAGVFMNITSLTNNKRIRGHTTTIGWSTPATTSATTYKLRFGAISSGTVTLINATNTAQLYAIEVSA